MASVQTRSATRQSDVKLRLLWNSQDSSTPSSSSSCHNESCSRKTSFDALTARLAKKFKCKNLLVFWKPDSSVELVPITSDKELQALFSKYFLELTQQKTSATSRASMATYRLRLVVRAATLEQEQPSSSVSAAGQQELCTLPSNQKVGSPCQTPVQKKRRSGLENFPPVPLTIDAAWDQGVLHSIIRTISKHHFCSQLPPVVREKDARAAA